MGSLTRKINRRNPINKQQEIEKRNELNRMVANAMHDQLNQLGIDPREIDVENDIKESSVTTCIRKVTHYHYNGMLLVEVIRDRIKGGFNYRVRVPLRETDGDVIRDSEGYISVN